MKKIASWLLPSAVFITIICWVISCTKQENQKPDNNSQTKQLAQVAPSVSNLTTTCGSCGAYFSGTHTGKGLYTYPLNQLDLSCATPNTTVVLSGTYYDVPNKFTIKDKNGNIVVTTGWIGNAPCTVPTPIGPVNTLQATVSVNFTYNPSLAPYSLEVMASVLGCGTCTGGTGCTSSDDNWLAYIGCVRNDQKCPTCDTSHCGSGSCGCTSCGGFYSGNHVGKGDWLYPSQQLDLSCDTNNSVVKVGCIFYDVPNKFNIYDKNNNLVVTSNWIGWAHCPTPQWGAAATTAQAEPIITFVYKTALAPYRLQVETLIIGCTNGCSTDVGCTSLNDDWGADVWCQ